MITFGLYCIQARKCLECGIADIEDKEGRKCTDDENKNFESIAQAFNSPSCRN